MTKSKAIVWLEDVKALLAADADLVRPAVQAVLQGPLFERSRR